MMNDMTTKKKMVLTGTGKSRFTVKGDKTALTGMTKLTDDERLTLQHHTMERLPSELWVDIRDESVWKVSPLKQNNKIGYERLSIHSETVHNLIYK